MNIDIDDSISGTERRKLLRLEPVRYALELYDGRRRCVAEWLGISSRTLRNILTENPELFMRKRVNNATAIRSATPEDALTDEERCRFNEEVEIVKSKPGWRFADKERRKLIIRKIVLRYIKEREAIPESS